MEGLLFLEDQMQLLNPGGVRIGTAEIYRQVEKIKFISRKFSCWSKL